MSDNNETTPGDGDDSTTTGLLPADGAASPPDPAASEGEAPETGSDDMIDVMVRGPVLGAKVGRVMSVTPEVYANYKPFLRRIG